MVDIILASTTRDLHRNRNKKGLDLRRPAFGTAAALVSGH
jgi:hypothetical protein